MDSSISPLDYVLGERTVVAEELTQSEIWEVFHKLRSEAAPVLKYFPGFVPLGEYLDRLWPNGGRHRVSDVAEPWSKDEGTLLELRTKILLVKSWGTEPRPNREVKNYVFDADETLRGHIFMTTDGWLWLLTERCSVHDTYPCQDHSSDYYDCRQHEVVVSSQAEYLTSKAHEGYYTRVEEVLSVSRSDWHEIPILALRILENRARAGVEERRRRLESMERVLNQLSEPVRRMTQS